MNRTRKALGLGVLLLIAIAITPALGTGGVLKTGQTKCWDINGNQITCIGTGQDGDLQIGVARSYTDNGDGTITDNATGLMWEKLDHFDFVVNYGDIHDTDNTYNPWTAAFQKIANLNTMNFAGHSDWRLPNLKELQSLISFSRSAPAVESAFNNGTDSFTRSTGSYWSSTTSNDIFPSRAWVLSFTTGAMSVNSKTATATTFCCFVRAVRGPITLSPTPAAYVIKTGQTQCWDSSGNLISCAGTGQDGDTQIGVALSYKDNNDGTITDLSTGLTWEKLGSLDGTLNDNLSDPHDADNNYITWDLAFQKIANLNAANFAGHSDWRMPNIKELESLVDFGNYGPAVDSAFNNSTDSFTRSSGYWSATTSLSLSAWANGEAFLSGNTFPTLFKTNPFGNGAVRAVRGGVARGAGLTLTKTPNQTIIENGSSVTYTYNVTNTGDINLTVNISDDKLGVILAPTLLTPGESNITTEVATIFTTGTLFTNNATATGHSDGFVNVTAITSATVQVVHPNVSITKTCTPATQAVPGNITWTIVTNDTGDTDLFVIVNDSLHGTVFANYLKPNDSNVTVNVNTSLPPGTYTNNVTANGTVSVDGIGISPPIKVSATSSATCTVTPSFNVTKDFRITDVNFTAVPAQLGFLLPMNDSKSNVSYVIQPKTGTVASTNPGQLYGVVTINGTGVQNITINDTFGTQFVVWPAHIDGGVEVLRVNKTTGVATVITDTQVTASTVSTAGPVNLTINLTTPLASDETIMVYIKYMTSLKGLPPDYSDFVNTAVVTTNLGGSKTATTTINFLSQR